ncbi:L-rhamnose mutarotase [Paenarthrobacter nitroguajacolicus]|uniref:L-rhamnose mutarotase n=1 Tax=Paenarthrobacter nitroguajacolicus TaxID=211146 RepID=A0A558H413_PAENT|nr:L-rhamnose mutarotase [Paenarthrobacter nitroguajacolicus]TVU63869.1 L-rhamnose mutarotase [Paenarthrobacter nitroguajacolicus]
MRVCFRSSVQPELMDEYKERHAAVWPEMLLALKNAGWNNYSLFLGSDGQLIGYLECEDYAAAQAHMALTDVNARWQAEMATLFANSNVPPDQGFEIVEEVFNLEDQLAAAGIVTDATGTTHIDKDSAHEYQKEQA